MWSEQDLQQLQVQGITVEKLEAQLQAFKSGFPYLPLYSAASLQQGVMVPTEEERHNYIQFWEQCLQQLQVLKFVPASGAASRMFKNLFAFLDASYDEPQTDFEKAFFNGLYDFAFADALNDACLVTTGKSLSTLLEEKAYKKIVSLLLEEEGLDYGHLPKGLLLFHAYADEVRTPVEEHLEEGLRYCRQGNDKVGVHFTISPEHEELFADLVARIVPEMEARSGATFEISFSQQKSSTDTIAATPENMPFRNEDGTLLFRPGGHGALIENLNEMDADVVFVKNIDNVVPDRLKAPTVTYKKLLAGILCKVQQQIFDYARRIDEGQYDEQFLSDLLNFLETTLCCHTNEVLQGDALVRYLRTKLNRPLRVCGVVRNVGEPGGGPFLAYNADGTVSPQILESSQIDMNDPAKKTMFESGAYFNPVDLVCGLKNYKGEKFDLRKFVDPATGFISHKSKNGRELKALELPGLWNGAMSDWNTIFVEVPLETFNPVKTVNDLLRDEHRA